MGKFKCPICQKEYDTPVDMANCVFKHQDEDKTYQEELNKLTATKNNLENQIKSMTKQAEYYTGMADKFKKKLITINNDILNLKSKMNRNYGAAAQPKKVSVTESVWSEFANKTEKAAEKIVEKMNKETSTFTEEEEEILRKSNGIQSLNNLISITKDKKAELEGVLSDIKKLYLDCSEEERAEMDMFLSFLSVSFIASPKGTLEALEELSKDL